MRTATRVNAALIVIAGGLFVGGWTLRLTRMEATNHGMDAILPTPASAASYALDGGVPQQYPALACGVPSADPGMGPAGEGCAAPLPLCSRRPTGSEPVQAGAGDQTPTNLAPAILSSPRAAGGRAVSTTTARLPDPAARRLFMALRQIESGGNDRAIGDGGRSRGPYQIGLAYWVDGGGLPERYALDVWDAAACERVMLGYWRRYCPQAVAAGDWETLARVHNGGPGGARKSSTLPYWRRVRKEMER